MKLLFRLETGNYYLSICIESIDKTILGIHISNEINMFVAENFIRSLMINMENIMSTQMVVLGIL